MTRKSWKKIDYSQWEKKIHPICLFVFRGCSHSMLSLNEHNFSVHFFDFSWAKKKTQTHTKIVIQCYLIFCCCFLVAVKELRFHLLFHWIILVRSLTARFFGMEMEKPIDYSISSIFTLDSNDLFSCCFNFSNQHQKKKKKPESISIWCVLDNFFPLLTCKMELYRRKKIFFF